MTLQIPSFNGRNCFFAVPSTVGPYIRRPRTRCPRTWLAPPVVVVVVVLVEWKVFLILRETHLFIKTKKFGAAADWSIKHRFNLIYLQWSPGNIGQMITEEQRGNTQHAQIVTRLGHLWCYGLGLVYRPILFGVRCFFFFVNEETGWSFTTISHNFTF